MTLETIIHFLFFCFVCLFVCLFVCFGGFTAEDIVLYEVKYESDIDVSDVSSVHTANLSDWDDNLSDSDDPDEGTTVDAPRDNQGLSTRISSNEIKEFDGETGPKYNRFQPLSGFTTGLLSSFV